MSNRESGGEQDSTPTPRDRAQAGLLRFFVGFGTVFMVSAAIFALFNASEYAIAVWVIGMAFMMVSWAIAATLDLVFWDRGEANGE